MSYTEEQIEKAATAIASALPPPARGLYHGDRQPAPVLPVHFAAARAALEVVQPEDPPLEDLLLTHLVEDSLPGRAVSIGYNEGRWHVAQEYCGVDESYPTGVVGDGTSINEAVKNAVRDAKGPTT